MFNRIDKEMAPILRALGNGGFIKIFEVNGAWHACTEEDADNLRRCGLAYDGGYLDYDLLLQQVSQYGFGLEVDEWRVNND